VSGKTDIHESEEKIRAHRELSAKQLDYFLRSNKSNINERWIRCRPLETKKRKIGVVFQGENLVVNELHKWSFLLRKEARVICSR